MDDSKYKLELSAKLVEPVSKPVCFGIHFSYYLYTHISLLSNLFFMYVTESTSEIGERNLRNNEDFTHPGLKKFKRIPINCFSCRVEQCRNSNIIRTSNHFPSCRHEPPWRHLVTRACSFSTSLFKFEFFCDGLVCCGLIWWLGQFLIASYVTGSFCEQVISWWKVS